ncbi:hypothetical protein EDD16DRAFT_1543332 [Pisolithus croceorrhizus]|nr:hypothetical protein EDD16DRAFT_1543332 [Pisolithus croceorrhizus]
MLANWQESAHQEALALRSFATWLAHFAFFAPGSPFPLYGAYSELTSTTLCRYILLVLSWVAVRPFYR